MSWLSGITGKAESLLNRLDQSAAEALQTDDQESPSKTQQLSRTRGSEQYGAASYTPSASSLYTSQSVPSNLSELDNTTDPSSSLVSTPVKQSSLKTQSSHNHQSTPKAKKMNDDELFMFLNSNDAMDSGKKKITPSSARHSRQSSTSSIVSNKSGKNMEPANAQTIDVESTHGNGRTPSSSSSRGPTPNMDVSGNDMDNEGFFLEASGHVESAIPQEPDSALELQNKLLNSEVVALNQEMASVIQRAKTSEQELIKTKKQLSDFNKTASRSDQMVRELQDRDGDLTEALSAKDSQLAILRVRLEEADRSLHVNHEKIQLLSSQREMILKDHTDSSGVHNQALETVKEKLSEVEIDLRREKEAYKKIQHESTERQSKLETEQRSLADAITAKERKFNEEKVRVSELTGQMKSMKVSLTLARQELSDYKDKASRILQSKERLIASLREGSGAAGDSVGVSSLEYESVKQERDMFKEEQQQAKMSIENMRLELQDMEAQLQSDNDTAQDEIQTLEDQLRDEKHRKEDAEQEVMKLKHELQYAIEEMHKQKMSFQTHLGERESDIDRLRNQLTTKNISSTTESELESRVRALTESLIQKQTVLESLSTEKNSLAMQLERLEQQYQDVQASSLRTNTTVVSVSDDDEVRQRVPGFLRETPNDTEVTRRVKRAANTVDRFSIRLGVFLRRYPIARVFVILYMAMLHVWVLIVLLTYQPEIHGIDYQPKPPKGGT